MSERAKRPSNLDAPTAARSTSLRRILWFGLTVCLVLGIGSFGVVIDRLLALTDARAESRDRYTRAIESRQRLLAAMLEQEVERADAPAALHARIAVHRAVIDDLARRRSVVVEDHERRIRVTIGAAGALALLGTTFSVAMVVWVLRRTARPLEQLSRLALDGQAFPAPGDGVGVREVDTLAWALHELDLAVRDREERLAEAHTEAVELSRFGEHVQQIVDEAEFHDVLSRRLVAVSDAHATVTLVHAQGRLHVSSSARERIDLPILAEPTRCRAVRTLRPVTADASSPTACRCPLVPAGGSYLCEPMIAASELVGVVNLQASWKAHFTERIQKRVRDSLGFGATALASLRLLASTRERALRDPLTGAYNRAFLAEYLGKHLAHAGRRGASLGVLAVDLDHFKRLNDTHGHAAGDRALIATVDAIQREVRSTDAVVRHGGEEIVVVLVDTDLGAATEVAERIRRGIAAIVLESDHGAVEIRASIGVAAFPEHGADQEALLAAADRALYQAKDAGRDRVIAAAVGVSAT